MKNIAYIFDEDLLYNIDRLPVILNRGSIVQDLIDSYELLNSKNVTVVESCKASENELKDFHSSSYVDFLKKANDIEDLELLEEEASEFGLSYDCHLLEKNYSFIQSIGGGSLTAAKLLTEKSYDIVINWFGGWHHAQRDTAEGFCYVNDVVLAIQKLYQVYKRILYIDFDVHHGNGVQNAFEFSNTVLTLSFHKFAPGFYPGSGDLNDVGYGKGKFYSLNVPLMEETSDQTYFKIFSEIFPRILESFAPLAIVVQCGADGLNGDPVGQWNLTSTGMGKCVQEILKCHLPTLFLGGGGYNFENTARYWTYLTSLICSTAVDNDIPSTSEYFTNYGPYGYELLIEPGKRKDCNTESHINRVINSVKEYVQNIEINNKV